MCRVPPYVGALVHGLIGMIFNGVDLRILNVGPILPDGLVVAFVCGVAMLEGTVTRWDTPQRRFLYKKE